MESLDLKSFNQACLATTGVGAFMLFVLLYNVLWKKRTGSYVRIAPEPAGAWPLVGHLPLLLEPNLPHKVFGALADKYGPVFCIRLGLHRALVINSCEAAKECFTTNDKALAARPRTVAFKIMGYDYATFAFTSYGPYWREVRRIAVHELLSNHRLDMLKDVRISEVDMSVRELYELWEIDCKHGNNYTMVEMKGWLSDMTLNVTTRMVGGKRYFGSSAKLDDKADEGKRLQKARKDFFHLAGLFVLSDAVPFLGWLDFRGHEKSMKITAKEADIILERWLEEHKQKKLSSGGAKADKDFMGVLLSVLEDNKLPGYDADTVNKATCWGIILGTADTTRVTMTWALSLLLNNRHTLKKAQDEIDTIVGKDRKVNDADVDKLVYLQAIVKETLRLYPASPLLAQHEAIEDCAIAGYHVAAGTRLIPNVWKIQRDPRLWPNPDEFQPERFLTSHANINFRGQDFGLIPFGSGRRSCPGISFGLQVIHLVLARLLQGFNFETPSGEAVDMTESAGLTNLKLTPLQVLVTPRLSSNQY